MAKDDEERARIFDLDARVLRELGEVKSRMAEAIERLEAIETELSVRHRRDV